MAALRTPSIPSSGLQRSLSLQTDSLSKRLQSRVASAIPGIRRAAERSTLRVCASNERFDIGDFGARDPYAAELESNFADKVLGNADTEHRILLPSRINEVAGLSARTCEPLPAGTQPLTEPEARELLKRVVGWKLVEDSATPSAIKLRGEWRVKDEESAKELMRRVGSVVEGQQQQCGGSQQADMSVEQGYVVRVDLHTPEIGGLSANDFIIAAKVDLVKVSDLIKKNRFWA